jgi:hypothetical protein
MINKLYKKLSIITEGSPPSSIFRKGESQGLVKEAQSVILRTGAKKLGIVFETVTAATGAITLHDRLERMIDRVLDANDWDDLLATT